mgnify:CR=1 FL=1
MNEKQKLQIQVDKVIELLKIRIEDDPTRPILNTLIDIRSPRFNNFYLVVTTTKVTVVSTYPGTFNTRSSET